MTMNKNTGRQTATTITIDPMLDELDPQDAADLSTPYVWESVTAARLSIRIMQRYGDTYRVVEHEAPGLSVFAVYRRAHRNAEAVVLMSVIVIEDEFIARLTRAVRRERPVTIGYTKQYDGESTVRTVEPTSLKITKSGNTVMGGRDRRSGEYRSFRVDLITDVTVHRSRFVLDEARTEMIAGIRAAVKARRDAEKLDAVRADVVRVESIKHGWTGWTVPESIGAGASGWSVIVEFDFEHAHRTPTGSTRANLTDLKILPGFVLAPRTSHADTFLARSHSTEYSPAQRAAWRTLASQN